MRSKLSISSSARGGKLLLLDGVTFCYPIFSGPPRVLRYRHRKKAAATQSDNGLMYPPGWNLWTRYTRVIVFTNSCQALILRLPAVLHTPRFPCHRHADACIDVGRHAGRQYAHQLTGVHGHLTLADVRQMLVQHPLDAFQNAGLPVNNGLLAGNAVLRGWRRFPDCHTRRSCQRGSGSG